ncbi:MAG: DCC1-like thiol-disulfide oxidoreductase family protein [Thermoplasmata archaeon]|nr:DCC1-like thiol-disulfide oxidoreductase family protein [Thermoplasmata archaeon]
MHTRSRPRPTLLFDGQCRLCSALARLVAWWDFRGGVRVVPFQDPAGRRLVWNLTDWEVERSAHFVLEDGEVLSRGAAFPALLDRLPVLGPVHRRLGHRPLVSGLVTTLYRASYAVRGATRCANPRRRPRPNLLRTT